MQRRAILAGLTMLLPGAALAQQPMPAPDGMAQPRQQQPKTVDLQYGQLNPRQRQRIAQALAGPGAPPLSPTDAQQRWDSMQPTDRRRALRAYRQATQAQGAAPPR